MRIWRRTGMTVVFITHSVEEAVYLGTEWWSCRPVLAGSSGVRLPLRRQQGDRDIFGQPISAQFIAMREQVLSVDLADGDRHDPRQALPQFDRPRSLDKISHE